MRLTPESEPNFKVRCSSGYQPVVIYDAGRQVYVIAQRLPGCDPEFALSYRVRREIRIFKTCPVGALEQLGLKEVLLMLTEQIEECVPLTPRPSSS